MNPRILKIVKYALSLGLLTWLITRTDLMSVAKLIVDADQRSLLVALGAYLASVLILAYRWQVLLVARRIQLSLSRATMFYFIGNFFSNFLPTSIGGDAVRAYSAGTDLGQRADAFASVFIERFVGLFAIVTMALVGILMIALQLEHTYIVPATIILFVLMVVSFPILFSRWWVNRLKPVFQRITIFDFGCRVSRLHEMLYRYGEHRGALLANFFLSILYQSLIVVMNIFVALGLNIPIHPMYFFVFVPMIGVISMFPFSINALGVREGGYVLLFEQIGRSMPEALALSLTLYGITVISSLPGGLLFAMQRKRRPIDIDREQAPLNVLTED